MRLGVRHILDVSAVTSTIVDLGLGLGGAGWATGCGHLVATKAMLLLFVSVMSMMILMLWPPSQASLKVARYQTHILDMPGYSIAG